VVVSARQEQPVAEGLHRDAEASMRGPSALQLLREGRSEEFWERCCGFIDLTLDQFMTIQRRLLLEQIELLKRCPLGNQVMQGARPRGIDEFREQVPITRYADYAPYLQEQMEDALPEKPMFWQRTSGRSEEYVFKWVPVTERMYRELGDVLLSVIVFASCRERGDIVLEEHDRFLYAMAPPPYASGCWSHRAAEEGIFDFLPPMDQAEKMDFEERLTQGFRLALFQGMDLLFALTGLLVVMGEQFGQGGGLGKLVPLLKNPGLLLRMVQAMVRAKIAGRQILPKDIWRLKMLVCFGMDTAVYREKLREMWGRYPLDVYGSTETVMIATQTWDYRDMVFIPYINFLEFVPEEDYRRMAVDQSFQPQTYLLDEVEPNRVYGLVITNFYGGAYVRYMLGDLVTITSLRNEALDIDIPQMQFHSRLDNVINIDGFAHNLSEATMWQAVEDSGVPYRDWLVKQGDGDRPRIRFYIEPRNGASIDTLLAAESIRLRLGELDPFYHVLERMKNVTLDVCLLPEGAFASYMNRQRAAGADLAHIKPPHINPSDNIVEFLMGAGSPR